VVHNEIDSLLKILPTDLAHSISNEVDTDSITEIVLDLGCTPYAWIGKERISIGDTELVVSVDDLQHILSRVGNKIGLDNRVGINKQLCHTESRGSHRWYDNGSWQICDVFCICHI
jgi:stage III sporulation protein SpoIIIAA